MSIVGFRVVPNNNYLNACTCVCPAPVPPLAALRPARRGCRSGLCHRNLAPRKSAGPPARRASSHVRLEGFVYSRAIWALLSVPESDLMSSNDSLQVCGSCSCWKRPGSFWSAHEFGGFLQVLHRQFFCRMKFSLLLVSAAETGGTCYLPCKTYLFTGKRSFFMVVQSVNGVDWEKDWEEPVCFCLCPWLTVWP